MAAYRLVELLVEWGEVDAAVTLLRGCADAGNFMAAYRLAELLAERGDVDALRERTDAGDWAGRIFRIGIIRVVRPPAADSCSRRELLAGFGSPALSEDVWYCSGTRCSVPRLCGRVHALGTQFGSLARPSASH